MIIILTDIDALFRWLWMVLTSIDFWSTTVQVNVVVKKEGPSVNHITTVRVWIDGFL